MAYPASQLHPKFQDLLWSNDAARAVKTRLITVRDESLAGDVQRDTLRAVQRLLHMASERWNGIGERLPGVGQFAQDVINDPTLDVVAEFTALRTAAIDLRDWIHANFPTDSTSGVDLSYTSGSDGTLTPLVFTTAQLATFRDKADVIIGMID